MQRVPLILAAILTVMAASGCGGDVPDDAAEAPVAQGAPANNGPSVLDPGASAEANADLPAPAPDFSVATLAGAPFALAAHRGEVILVNFWATWCGPCIIEIPDLQELYDTYGERGLTVLGVSVEDGEDDLVREFVAEYAMTYPVAISMDLADAFGGVYGLPTTFVIDKSGQIVERVIGLFPTEEMIPRLEALLAAETV